MGRRERRARLRLISLSSREEPSGSTHIQEEGGEALRHTTCIVQYACVYSLVFNLQCQSSSRARDAASDAQGSRRHTVVTRQFPSTLRVRTEPSLLCSLALHDYPLHTVVCYKESHTRSSLDLLALSGLQG